MGLYPEPKHFDGGRLTMHQRYRVVVQQFDEKDAIALAEQISETCACDLEVFVAVVDDDAGGELRGEAVLARKFYPCKGAMVPATANDE